MGFYTAKEISRVLGDDYKVFFHIGEKDVQAIAIKEFGIVLSSEEFEEVDKEIEWDYLNWKALVKTAIAKVLKEKYGYKGEGK